jgi:hypothetical protein
VNAAYIKATTQHNSEQMVDGMISLYKKCMKTIKTPIIP